MDVHTATECAYKNGYARGVSDTKLRFGIQNDTPNIGDEFVFSNEPVLSSESSDKSTHRVIGYLIFDGSPVQVLYKQDGDTMVVDSNKVMAVNANRA